MAVNPHLAKQGFHAEGARFVGHDRYNQLAEFGVTHQLGQQVDIGHGGGQSPLAGAFEIFTDHLFGLAGHGVTAVVALRQMTTQSGAALFKVEHFGTVGGWPVKGRFNNFLVADRNIKAGAKSLELVFIELFLGMGNIFTFARFAQTVTFNGMGQHHRWCALMFDRSSIGRINLVGIMAAAGQIAQLVISVILHQFKQFGIFTEEMFTHIGPIAQGEALHFAIDHFIHALHQLAALVFGQQPIPVIAPNDLDHVPAGTTEVGFEFLDNFAITTHRTVEALQIAVNDKDQVIELFARRQTDGSQRFGFIHFAIAQHCPDLAATFVPQTAIDQIMVETRLINSRNGRQPHGNRGKFPEIGHQKRMWIGRKPALGGAQFTPEAVEIVLGQATFQEGARINPWGSMALEIDHIPQKFMGAPAPEVIEPHFPQGRG